MRKLLCFLSLAFLFAVSANVSFAQPRPVDKTVPKNGRGVQPEVASFPTIDAVKKGSDYKLEKAMEMIKKDKEGKK